MLAARLADLETSMEAIRLQLQTGEGLPCVPCTCPENCLRCNSTGHCLKCISTHFLNPSDALCSPCSVEYGCKTCSSANNGQSCLSCEFPKFLWYVQSDVCVEDCGVGYFGDEGTRECDICERHLPRCRDCIDSSTCLECVDPFYLTSNSSCVDSDGCPLGTTPQLVDGFSRQCV